MSMTCIQSGKPHPISFTLNPSLWFMILHTNFVCRLSDFSNIRKGIKTMNLKPKKDLRSQFLEVCGQMFHPVQELNSNMPSHFPKVFTMYFEVFHQQWPKYLHLTALSIPVLASHSSECEVAGPCVLCEYCGFKYKMLKQIKTPKWLPLIPKSSLFFCCSCWEVVTY